MTKSIDRMLISGTAAAMPKATRYYVYMHVYLHMYKYIYMCVYVSVYVYVEVHVHVYMYVYVWHAQSSRGGEHSQTRLP